MKTTSAATNGCPRIEAARRRLRQCQIGPDPSLQERPAVRRRRCKSLPEPRRPATTTDPPAAGPGPSRLEKNVAADQKPQERGEAEERSVVVVDAAAGRRDGRAALEVMQVFRSILTMHRELGIRSWLFEIGNCLTLNGPGRRVNSRPVSSRSR